MAERLDFPDGQYVLLRTRIDHDADVRLKKAYLASKGNPDLMLDMQTFTVQEMLLGGMMLDVDGNQMDLADPKKVGQIPADYFETIWDKASDLYLAGTVPNSPTPPLSVVSSPEES